MRKFVKQTPFMKKLYLKNKFCKNTCIPKSSLLACTKFQADWTKADWLPHRFLAPTSCSQRLAWKTKNLVCPHKHCCTAQTCSQHSRFSRDCFHNYLLRACKLTRMYRFFFYIFSSSMRDGPRAFLALVSRWNFGGHMMWNRCDF